MSAAGRTKLQTGLDLTAIQKTMGHARRARSCRCPCPAAVSAEQIKRLSTCCHMTARLIGGAATGLAGGRAGGAGLAKDPSFDEQLRRLDPTRPGARRSAWTATACSSSCSHQGPRARSERCGPAESARRLPDLLEYVSRDIPVCAIGSPSRRLGQLWDRQQLGSGSVGRASMVICDRCRGRLPKRFLDRWVLRHFRPVSILL